MLTSYLNSFPYTKFLIIEDSVKERGKPVLAGLIKSRTKIQEHELNYFVFESNYIKTRNSIPGTITYHDFTSDLYGWMHPDLDKKPDFQEIVSQIKKPGVLIIDSLVHFIYLYGFKETYRILNEIINNNHYVLQIMTVLHSDLLDESNLKAPQFFQHLSTLYVTLEGRFNSEKPRVSYVYKKYAGKIIKEIEEYEFVYGMIKTDPIKKLDPKLLVEESIKEFSADDLTTFKISLDDGEKKARDKLVLPYLPKDGSNESSEGGKIFYQLDDVDDWDEEDPDDDLDI